MIYSVIHPQYDSYLPFVEKIPEIFDKEGMMIYKGRNELKRFVVGEESFIVKSFKRPPVINRFVYGRIRKSKARRSYENANMLLDAGGMTPHPVAYIEEYSWGFNRSYYISKEIKDYHEMREFWYEPQIGDRYYILDSFVELTARMHREKIIHKDYSAGNVIFTTNDREVVLYWIDINRMRFNKKVTEEEGYKNFCRLWLSDETYQYIAKKYAYFMGYDENHAVERILYYKNRFMAKS